MIKSLQEQAAQEAKSDREDSVCPTGNDEEQPEEGLNIDVCTVSCFFFIASYFLCSCVGMLCLIRARNIGMGGGAAPQNFYLQYNIYTMTS